MGTAASWGRVVTLRKFDVSKLAKVFSMTAESGPPQVAAAELQPAIAVALAAEAAATNGPRQDLSIAGVIGLQLSDPLGAMQTIELVQKYPGAVAAAAALGGGGTVRDAKALADLPLFVGVGDKDGIALAGARGLNKALAAGGAKKLVYKEYANVEHMVIVRAALPDAFDLFDRTAAEK